MKTKSSKELSRLVGVVLSAMLGLSSLHAADFTSYSIGKGLYYDQTAGGAPVLKAPWPWLFHAQLVAVSNYVSSASLFRSLALTAFLEPDSSGLVYAAAGRRASQAALDAAYPNTNYDFRVFTTHDGLKRVTNSMTAGVYPAAPNVTNLAAAQAVNAATDFTLAWEPFPGGTAADFIYCQIQSARTSVFHTGYSPAAPGALSGTATSVTIPAGTLASGRAYLGRLVFAFTQATYTNAYPGAWGASYYFSQTDFWIKTQGAGDSTPPTIVAMHPIEGATGVPTNKPITIRFSEPMNGSYIAPGNTIGGWSADGSILVLTPFPGLAKNLPLTYVLNPFQSPPVFGDVSGNPLAAEIIYTLGVGDGRLTPAAAVLTDAHLTTNGLAVSLLGESGYRYELESSTNFSTWLGLGTNIAFGGTAQFLDTNAPTAGARFYRAVAR